MRYISLDKVQFLPIKKKNEMKKGSTQKSPVKRLVRLCGET